MESMKVNYMQPPKEFRINSTEWWVKPLEMMVHNWALVENQATGETVIQNSACIQKSYPNFVASFQQIGACLE
jgi:hypothetical protein